MKNRSVGVGILLTFITCGIYGLYWFYVLTDEVNYAHGEQDTSGGMALVLNIITCHIYGIYWAYRMGEKIDKIKTESGFASSNTGVLYLLLVIFGFDFIVFALIQNELNHMSY